ncbi:MAG: sensor histidine kinase, partial [Bacteroidia bacterium]
ILTFKSGNSDVMQSQESMLFAILGNFIFVTLLWNLNLILLALVEPYSSWERSPVKKLIICGSIAVFLPIAVNLFFNKILFEWLYQRPCELSGSDNIMFLVISVVITLLINAIMLSIEFFEFWKKSLTEREALKRDNITAEFESLKNQVNPHFLFNSLNTLSSIIEEEPKTATQFVQKLSSVYRYVLAQRDKETVTLHEELNFIESYVYLNKIRFGENLKVEILVDESLRQSQIATLTLQLLMENAIKHNVVSKDKPLSIEIGIKNSRIYVKNNLQAKKIHAESNGIGLSNIISRYKYLSKEEVIVSSSNNYFEVSVPLID